MELAGTLDEWLAGDPLHGAVRGWERELYAPAYKALGWASRLPETTERAVLRKEVIAFLALTARDGEVRRAAVPLGRAYADGKQDAVSLDLASVALAVAVQEGDLAFFDALAGRLGTEQRPLARRVLLFALGSATQPELAARARELVMDPRLRGAEPLTLLDAALGQPETREAAWAWTRAHLDALLERLPESWRTAVVWQPARFCDRPHAEELERLFRGRIEAIPGGPRELAAALEEMKLCVARRSAEEPGARAFFAKKKRR
jgi:alanyl aminopeptidase